MAEEQQAAVSPADIQAVGEKLEEYSQSLPASQRAVIAWLLQRIGMEPEDESNVQGYAIVLNQRGDAATGAGPPSRTFEFECTWSLAAPQR